MKGLNKETIVSIVGLAFVWPVLRANYYGAFLVDSIDISIAAIYYFLLFGCLCLSYCFFSLYKHRLLLNLDTANRKRNITIGASGTICCVLLYVSQFAPNNAITHVIGSVAILLWALNFVAMIPAWSDYLRKLDFRSLICVMMGSFCLSLVFTEGSRMLPSPADMIVLAVCPFLSAVFYSVIPQNEKQKSTPESEHSSSKTESESTQRQMSGTLFLMSALILIASATEGFFYVDGTLGFPEFDNLVYGLFLFIFTALFGIVLYSVNNMQQCMGSLRVSLVCMLAIGFVFLLILAGQFSLIAESFIVGAKCLMECLLWVVIITKIRHGLNSAYSLNCLYIIVQTVAGIIAYCALPILYYGCTITLKGVVGVSFVAAVGVVAFYLIQKNRIQLTARTKLEKNLAATKEEATKRQVPSSNEQAVSLVKYQYGLTAREADVFDLLAKGFSKKVIAEELFISVNTVKTHVRNIYQRTGCSNQDELSRLIYETEKNLDERLAEQKK